MFISQSGLQCIPVHIIEVEKDEASTPAKVVRHIALVEGLVKRYCIHSTKQSLTSTSLELRSRRYWLRACAEKAGDQTLF